MYDARVVVLAAYLCGCSSTQLPLMDASVAQRLRDDPDGFIVAGVDNDDAMIAGHPGSSPKGYDNLGVYAPSARAAAIMKALEHDYHLREITAWPIPPLHMQCAVLELPAGADRAAILAALTHDRRVRTAQPLQKFATKPIVHDPSFPAPLPTNERVRGTKPRGA
jgi:hypothetical protein